MFTHISLILCSGSSYFSQCSVDANPFSASEETEEEVEEIIDPGGVSYMYMYNVLRVTTV